ncbi:hypothetical protein M0L20_29530 [Spirosoma sp. RP8]|uniref:Uncharacterized protein n=1 Tax=Spirosoma liriopis TaxID=2937440 RepID=A0ABT0HV74_9BACT|nr:hypothetical protein [Spirosoma liriopis]MCK8496044.1 hypothetical protein [Spirosoma liriopis]
MDYQQVVPIEIKRTDPVSGVEYTFRAEPPIDITTFKLLPRGMEAKEFILNILWQIKAGIWDTEGFPNLEGQVNEVLPLIKEVIASVNLHYTDADETTKPGDRYKYYYTLTYGLNTKGESGTIGPISDEMASMLLSEVLNSLALEVAVSWYIDVNKQELERLAERDKERGVSVEKQEKDKPGADNRTRRLFSNSKELDPSTEWSMPKFVADNWGRATKGANRSTAIAQYEGSSPNPRTRKTTYKIQGRETETEFIFDHDKLAIKTAEEFADKLMKLKDAKVLQTFFALMKWANIRDSSIYRDVPISELMELILKPSGEGKFNTQQRREFSEVLEYLASMSITVSIIGEQVNKKTGRGRAVLKEEKGVKLFRLEATYSVKKEYQSIPKESLNKNLHFDKSVITRFSGELLPGKPHLFGQRASIYFDSLLHLDANKDSKAIVLGFQIQTRFNQFQDKAQCIEYDRGFLIDLCDYNKTDNIKPSKATKQLSNNLDKLVRAGIISGYSGLTHDNSDRVTIQPPKAIKSKALTT